MLHSSHFIMQGNPDTTPTTGGTQGPVVISTAVKLCGRLSIYTYM
jgi:hypothetical protein